MASAVLRKVSAKEVMEEKLEEMWWVRSVEGVEVWFGSVAWEGLVLVGGLMP